ncbi:MAG: penicillin acylase family protein [Opitutales bacterium]|nr:penicillin acylase family protein [Opitutales bacterium]
MRSGLKCFGWILSALLVLLFSFLLAGWFLVRGSLAQLDGERVLPDLSAPVEVERDAFGRVRLVAENRLDLTRALGFLHAQDRFFQMDLTRRSAAGELAELFGEGVLDFDRERRLHQARSRLQRTLDGLVDEDRVLLQAYSHGVNAGLEALMTWPWPYLVLRSRPRPWEPIDSLLVGMAMAMDLQDYRGDLDRLHGLAREHMPESVFDYLMEHPSALSAPMLGELPLEPAMPSNGSWREWLMGAENSLGAAPIEEGLPVGSNAWAIGPAGTRHGRPLISFDMHLRHQLPNTWYYAYWSYGQGGDAVEAVGLTLPGMPLMIAGSNGSIAWGFTNAYIDQTDLVELELNGDRQEYLSMEGWERIEIETERIEIAGRSADLLPVRLTRWGPILSESSASGKSYALAWAGHRSGFLNLRLWDLEGASGLEEAFARADEVRMPVQNLVLVDAAGHIGWRLIGGVPERRVEGGRFPHRSAELDDLWDGFHEDNLPGIQDPANARVWTANSVVSTELDYTSLGEGGFHVDGRSWMIRERLLERDDWDERSSAELQLDLRSVVMERWHRLFLETLDERALHERPSRNRIRQTLLDWRGGATVDSSAYLLVWSARERVGQQVLRRLFEPLRRLDPGLDFRFYRWEEPVFRLVTEQPSGASDPQVSSWRSEILRALDESAERLEMEYGSLDAANWGAFNRVQIKHPLSGAFPLLARLLDMEEAPIPGDRFSIRTQHQALGQSQRLTVSPGYEAAGLFNMPGGASEHFLSPFYRSGHEEWLVGEPLPLLPGRARHRLTLRP